MAHRHPQRSFPCENSQSERSVFPATLAISLVLQIRNASEGQCPYENHRKANAIFAGRVFFLFFSQLARKE